MRIFDTHAHYDDEAFDEDRTELLEALPKSGIARVTNIGCDMATSRAVDFLTKKYDYIYGAIGVIPHHVDNIIEADLAELSDMAKKNPKIRAIGEIGLDHHYDHPEDSVQRKWFRAQMDLARSLSLPIVIHSRDAAQETIDMMREAHAEEIGGVMHCYSYSPEVAEIILKMGFFLGIGGVVTFKNSKKLKQTVRMAPLDRLVLETDAPYLTPSPHRGERNDSRYIPLVIEEIARLKEISPEEVEEACWQNALRLYRMSE